MRLTGEIHAAFIGYNYRLIAMTTPTKAALVTGSTSGIGLASARALARRGVNVVITGFGDENGIRSIIDEFKCYGVRADYVSADLSKVTDIDNLWSEVTRLYPEGIDILVNVAGFWFASPIEQFPDGQWNLQIDVMLTAPFHLIKRTLPAMKTKGWGRIVNLSSVAGLVGAVNCAAYVAAKHGLIGLTKGVALESAICGITCNAVCPGPVETSLLTYRFEDQAKSNNSTAAAEIQKHVVKNMPTGKLIQSEQIAELVEFLCLSNASSQITGATYIIDGGYMAK